MTKNELIQLHRLGNQLRTHLDNHPDTDTPDGTYTDYDELGISPTDITSRKQEHLEAVLELFNGLSNAATNTSTDTDAPDTTTPTIDSEPEPVPTN